MKITKEIFKSFLACPYKTYLLSKGEAGVKSDYEMFFKEKENKYHAEAMKQIGAIDVSLESICESQVNGREGSIYQTDIEQNGISSSPVVFERAGGGSAIGAFHYVPVICSSKERLSKEDKIGLAYDGFILENVQARRPKFGKVVSGVSFKATRLRVDSQIEKVRSIVARIKAFDLNSPRMILNRHCHVCEFSSECRAKAIEKDDLSLLEGIGQKEIEEQNKKGIFTVTQYSYTFRPRRKRKDTEKYKARNLFALRALAIRENKIHVHEMPVLVPSNPRIYFDIEGDPDRDFYYLIGMIIEDNGVEQRHSFWANHEAEEDIIFDKFLTVLRNYSNPFLFHYGSYETKFFKKIRNKTNEEYGALMDVILKNSINVLSLLYSKVYFPTYSNGLKDIGNYFGLKWTSENASGIQSILWRRKWETDKSEGWKEKLLTYNHEDCLALKKITETLHTIGADNASARSNSSPPHSFIRIDNLKEVSNRQFGKVDFASSDLDYINRCAYFDYQRNKVFIRTNKTLKRIKRIQKKHRNQTFRVNKRINLTAPQKCPACGCKKIYRNPYSFKKVIDLKFSASGVKRWVTISRKARFTCAKCKKCFAAQSFQRGKYGHGLLSWIAYHNIALNQPFAKIGEALGTLFGLHYAGQLAHQFKVHAAKYYEGTYRQIIETLMKSDLIHIDETKVNIKGHAGYVWVFTNMEEVAFVYTPTREGGFLKEFLKDFKGVLISDFYAVYDAINCPQQKCLIHLIRDLNDDLLKSPFDEEFKDMASNFSILLRKIVDTIDKYGLKKRNLNKHKKEVAEYFDEILNKEYKSEMAKKYQTRFGKNKEKLFTFLNYDGIPWNNNNAEHSIKHFAAYRKIADGQFTEPGIKQYLILLSIFQTCKYKSIDFLKFMLSKSTQLPF